MSNTSKIETAMGTVGMRGLWRARSAKSLAWLCVLGLVAGAGAVEPRPSHKSLIFPSIHPKNGQPSADPGGAIGSGALRNSFETYYEGWWREVSYYRSNPTNGLNLRGYNMETKTYGYVALPWAYGVAGGVTTQQTEIAGTAYPLIGNYQGTLTNGIVAPGSLQLIIGGQEFTDYNQDGALEGPGAGTIDYGSGQWTFNLTNLVTAQIAIIAIYQTVQIPTMNSPAGWVQLSGPAHNSPDARGELNLEISEAGQPIEQYEERRNDLGIVPNPLIDLYWTSGERFYDAEGAPDSTDAGSLAPNGTYTRRILPEDRWTAVPIPTTGYGLTSHPNPANAVWNPQIGGEFFVDYDLGTDLAGGVVDCDAVPRPVLLGFDFTTYGGPKTNMLFYISEFNHRPDPANLTDPATPGDLLHRYQYGGAFTPFNNEIATPPISDPGNQADIPTNSVFDFQESEDGRPYVRLVGYLTQVMGFPVGRFEVNGNPDPTFVATNQANATFVPYNNGQGFPIYQAGQLWGERADAPRVVSGVTFVPGLGIVSRPSTNWPTVNSIRGPEWSAGKLTERNEDFVSWWKWDEGGAGSWIRCVYGHPNAPILPRWLTQIPVLGTISYSDYTAYISNNYPGDVDALIARCGNNDFDGADGFADITDNKVQIQGLLDGATDPVVMTPGAYGASGWDFYTLAGGFWASWWQSNVALDGTNPELPANVPNAVNWEKIAAPLLGPAGVRPAQRIFDELVVANLTVYGITNAATDPTAINSNVVQVAYPPLGSTFGYDAPREFVDMASSMYHYFGTGGDGRLGEVTSPWNYSIWGQDRGLNSPGRANTAPDYLLATAGPLAYDIMGINGLDAGNQLSLEFLSWRIDGTGPTGPRSVHAANSTAPVLYGGDHRDVNLDGLLDQGEVVPERSWNYFVDTDAATPDNGMDTLPLFGWERYMEDMIEAWDSGEDFLTVARHGSTSTGEVSVVEPSGSGFRFVDGVLASGTVANAAWYKGPIPHSEFNPAMDDLWVDGNANLRFDWEDALNARDVPAAIAALTDGAVGTALNNVRFFDYNGDGQFGLNSEMAWHDANANNAFDSEVVLRDPAATLQTNLTGMALNSFAVGVTGVWHDANANGFADRADNYWIEGLSTNEDSVVLGYDEYDLILYAGTPSNLNATAFGLATTILYRATNSLPTSAPGLQHIYWVDGSSGFAANGRYNAEPGVHVPLVRTLAFPTNDLTTIALPDVYYAAVTPAGYQRDIDRVWVDNAWAGANNGLYDAEVIINDMYPADGLVNGASGFALANVKYVDLKGYDLGTGDELDPDGVFSPLVRVDNGPEVVFYGDAVWIDGNNNDRYDEAQAYSVPLYAVGLHNPAGTASAGAYHSGNFYGAITRDNMFIGGFNQVQPAINFQLLTHEQCHDVLGWPDLYDYDIFDGDIFNTPTALGDLMTLPGAMVHGIPDLKSVFGVQTHEIKDLVGGTPGQGVQTLRMYPVERIEDQYYTFTRHDGQAGEYFSIWYQDGGSPYSSGGGRGVHIVHTDFGNSRGRPQQQRLNNHYTWHYVQADGLYQMEDGTAGLGPDDVFPGTTGNRLFTSDTFPNSRWWDQVDSGLRIVDVRIPANTWEPAEVDVEWVATSAGAPWTNPYQSVDSDNDGLADAWEMYWFSDYANPLNVANGTSDWDGDGLSDYAEWLAGLNPRFRWSYQLDWIDGTTNGPNDADADIDGDGLSNFEEYQVYRSNQLDPDSDDDGFSDSEEIGGTQCGDRKLSSPIYSRSPLIQRAAYFGAGDTVEIPSWRSNWQETQPAPGLTGLTPGAYPLQDEFRFQLTNWTLDVWIKLDDTNETGRILWRETAQGRTNFVLGIQNNRPYAGFTTEGGLWCSILATNAAPIVSNVWTRLAAVWSTDRRQLELYMANELVLTGTYLAEPAVGHPSGLAGDERAGTVYMGGGWSGYLDEVRIWGAARSQSQLTAAYDKTINTPWFTGQIPQTVTNPAAILPVLGEVMGTGQPGTLNYNGVLSNGNIIAGSVVIQAGVQQFTDTGTGALTGPPGSTGSIQYITGAWTLGFGSASNALNANDLITANYSYAVPQSVGTTNVDYTLANSIGNDGTLIAYFRFDDSRNTTKTNAYTGIAQGWGAEDYVHLNDWRYSINVTNVTTNSYALIKGTTSILHEDPIDDLNEDGIPDWWQSLWWPEFNPLAIGVWGPNEDPDGDGLINYFEYVGDTNPKNTDVSDPFADYYVDSDGDGIVNGDEWTIHGTDPFNPDTDDDNLSDGQEIRDLTSPVCALDPHVRRAVRLLGQSFPVPEGPSTAPNRFNMSAWTVEFWVNPISNAMNAALVTRYVDEVQLSGRINFTVALTNGQPYVAFETPAGQRYVAGGTVAIPTNEWTHLAGTWSPDNDELALFVNGIAYRAQASLELPAAGYGHTVLGDTNGTTFAYVDELRIWNEARTQSEITAHLNRFADFYVAGGAGAVNYDGIVFTDGDLAFADAVILSTPGADDGGGGNLNANPLDVLGPPDGLFYSMGVSDIIAITNLAGQVGYTWTAGELIVAFSNNVLKLSGDTRPDLAVFETADRPDGFYVWISPDGDNWYYGGMVGGGKAMLDLDERQPGNTNAFRYVRLVDGGTNLWTTLGMPGADIDAIGAIGYGSLPVAWYAFDDGQNISITNQLGVTNGFGAQDFIYPRDWETDWAYAIQGSNLTFVADPVAPVFGELDSDSDGLPDCWENLWFPLTGADGAADVDGDGLSNMTEFYAHTNPKAKDTDNDGRLDPDEDFDGDGLSNLEEQGLGTMPHLSDTDDDGIVDGFETRDGSDPLNAVSPFVERALRVDGMGYMQIGVGTDPFRYALTNFTIEAWIFPTNSAMGDGVIAQRQVGVNQNNYKLGITNIAGELRPYVRVTVKSDESFAATNDAVAIGRAGYNLPLNAWTHLAASLDAPTGELYLYLNGEKIATDLARRATPGAITGGAGPIFNRVGQGFMGLIDELRIWSERRPGTEIRDAMHARATWVPNILSATNEFLGNGVLAQTLYSGTFSNAPLVEGSVVIRAGYYYTFTDDGQGGLVSPYLGMTGMVDYATGAWTIDLGFALLSSFDVLDADYQFYVPQPLAGYFRFDDGGVTAQNLTFPTDWSNNWLNAGALLGDAAFTTNLPGRIPVADPNRDTDGDGLPDEWEIAHFGAITVSDGTGDYDSDGLTDYYEYLAGTNPKLIDTDGDDTLDKYEDPDGDGLMNIEEQKWGTHPLDWDTDDDAIGDLAEVNAAPKSSPLHSMGAYVTPLRSLSLTNVPAAGVDVPQDPAEVALRLSDWTVEAWFFSDTPAAQTGALVKKLAGVRTQFELGVQTGRPYIKFQTPEGTNVVLMAEAAAVVAASQWTHLAGAWDGTTRTLTLTVNGLSVYELALTGNPAYWPTDIPADAYGRVSIGENAGGWSGTTLADNVRIWNVALNQTDIEFAALNRISVGTDVRLRRDFRFDDGGVSIEDFAHIGDAFYALNAADYGIGTNASGHALWLSAAGQYVSGEDDSDGDGLPDWWESVNRVSERTGDEDGDGLGNYYEYLTLNDPNEDDTDGDTTLDGDELFFMPAVLPTAIPAGTPGLLAPLAVNDLTNLEEQEFGTHPWLSDTDEDGITDRDEIVGGVTPWPREFWPVSDPTLSLQNTTALPQTIRRSLSFNGAARVLVAPRAKYALPSWTVDAWVRPSALPAGRAVVLRRAVRDLGAGSEALNYELGVQNAAGALRPYIRYVTTNGLEYVVGGAAATNTSGDIAIALNRWTHLGGSFDDLTGVMLLYIDGMPVGSGRVAQVQNYPPTTGPNAARIEVTVGGGSNAVGTVNGFAGNIDEVRILAGAATPDAMFKAFRAASLTAVGGYNAGKQAAPGALAVFQATVAQALEREHVENELLVRFKPGVNAVGAQAVHARLNAQVVRTTRLAGVQQVRFTDGVALEQKLQGYRADPAVLYAEPNYKIYAQAIPNDPLFAQLWGLNNTGQNGGKADADIDAPEAWNRSVGSSAMIVAVIDTGVDYTHPDLAGNMWTNVGEIPGNGVDDDGNGYVDDVYGYDFWNGDGDPMDDHFHGTHCAGTIGAVGNNGMGVAGVNWNVRIMALKFLSAGGWGSVADSIQAVEYAVMMGAKISNNSYGSYGYSQSEYDTIAAARAAGHLFVASAGNDLNDNDGFWKSYPASYDLDNIISVAAGTRMDEMAWFSNYGQTSVDIVAPGEEILSTFPGGLYEYLDGTSMAGPHVAGAAALVWAMSPAADYGAVRAALLNNADKVDAFSGRCVTGARLNMVNALSGASGTAVAYFRADDGGARVEDMTAANDALDGWRFAALPQGAAAFDAAQFAQMEGDADADGLADWFESAYGVDNPNADEDGDGLLNLAEWLAGRNPLKIDSDNDGITDDVDDSDSDGVGNLVEQAARMHPGVSDSDDDGTTDAAEIAQGTNPAQSLHPLRNLALELDGSANPVALPLQPRLALDAGWTVEAGVYPAAGEVNGFVAVRRRVGASGVNYELGADATMRPYVAFRDFAGTERRVTAPIALTTERWTHLAGAYDATARTLTLYVDGVRIDQLNTTIVSPAAKQAGVVATHLGDGLLGRLDEVRLWNVAVPETDLYGRFRKHLAGGEGGLVAYYRFDDDTTATGSPAAGTSGGAAALWNRGQIQDFAGGMVFDWRTRWFNGGSIVTAGAWDFVARGGLFMPETDADNDGLPDWWELLYFGGIGITDGMGDADGDKLNDKYEFLAGTDPTRTHTYGGLVSDADLDSDSDGLTNVEEQNLYNTNPGKTDSDDDGVNDGVEVDAGTNPWHPMSQFNTNVWLLNMAERKSLDMGAIAGNEGIEMPSLVQMESVDPWTLQPWIYQTNRFALGTNGWSVEMWVYPETDGNGDLFHYEAAQGHSYRLSLTNGAPYGVIYDGTGILVEVGGLIRTNANGNVTGCGPMLTDRWNHLALVWAPEANSLRLYQNGVQLHAELTLRVADIGDGRAYLARGFSDGFVDEVRVWSRVRETKEITDWYEKLYPAPGYVGQTPDGWVPPHLGPFRSDYTKIRYDIDELPLWRDSYLYGQPLAAYYRFDDGGEMIEDFAHLGDATYCIDGPVTNAQAYNAQGLDDADGDGIPEWWTEMHELERWPEEQIGPYHVLDPWTGTDYPVSFSAGWITPVGTPGLPRGLYYNWRFQNDQWGVPIYMFNVWQDVNPDFDPNATNNAATNGPNDGLQGQYRGRGQYDDWDVRVWQDEGVWFTPTGTLGFTGMFFNDIDGDEMYTAGEDIWLERWNDADLPQFDVQEIIGVNYFRSFKAYGSVGDHAAWTVVDPGNTNEMHQREINWYETTKSTSVGYDGLYSCFHKYVYLDQDPVSASMEFSLFGTDAHQLYINGFLYDHTLDTNGTVLVSLLKRGRNQVYLYTQNTVAWVLAEIWYHYVQDYAREWTDMKFDMGLRVNDVDVIMRGDDTVADPRSVWHGQAWSEYWNANYVAPYPDLDDRLWAHQDYGLPRDVDRDSIENNYEILIGTNPRDWDTDNDGVPDGDEDYDFDGLANAQEQQRGADPRLPDTDDDSIIDGLDVAAGGMASDSLITLRPHALTLPGTLNDFVEMPIQPRFALQDWTVEAWVNPVNGWAGNGTVIRRQVGIAGGAQDNFVLGINGSLEAYVSFGSFGTNVTMTAAGDVYRYVAHTNAGIWTGVYDAGIGTNFVVQTNAALLATGSNWTHLAAVYDSNLKSIKLYVNGILAAKTNEAPLPARYGSGPIIQRVGEGFAGMVDDVRLWGAPVDALSISNRMGQALSGEEANLVSYYRFDDSSSGTPAGNVSAQPDWQRGHVEDHTLQYRADWKTEWRHAGTLVGNAAFVAVDSKTSPVEVPLDSDGDGLPDWWETQYSCLDAFNAEGEFGRDGDPDQDGYSNMDEFRAGTDPCAPDSIIADWVDNIENTDLDIQVGDTVPVQLTLAAQRLGYVFYGYALTSDETLFTVEPPIVTVGETGQVIDVTAVATAGGWSNNLGFLLIQNVSGSTDGKRINVRVYRGDDLDLLAPIPGDPSGAMTNDVTVAAGDTATVRIQRDRSDAGLISMPLVVSLTSEDPARVRVPATVTIPGGRDDFWFPVTGLRAGESVVIKAQAHGYPAADMVVTVTAPALEWYVDGALVSGPVSLQAGASLNVQVKRNMAQVGAELALDVQSSDASLLGVTNPVLFFATNQVAAWLMVNGIATSQGDGFYDGYVQLLNGDAATQLFVTVWNTNWLSVSMAASEVVAGDTATMTVRRSPAAASQPLTLSPVSVNPDRLSVPSNVVMLAGQTQVSFPLTGICPDTNGVYVGVLAQGFSSTNLLVRIAEPGLIISDAPGKPNLDPVMIAPDQTAYLTVWRPIAQSGAAFPLVLESENPDVFTVAPASLTIPAMSDAVTFGLRGVSGGTNFVYVKSVCGEFLASAEIAVQARLLVSGPTNLVMGDVRTFTVEAQVASNSVSNITVRLSVTDPAMDNAITYPATLLFTGGQRRASFDVEGVRVMAGVTIEATAVDGGFTVGTKTFDVVPPNVWFDRASYTVEEGRKWPVRLYRDGAFAGGSLAVVLTSSSNEVFTVPPGVTFPAGGTNVVTEITGVGGGAVSNAILDAWVSQAIGTNLAVDTAPVYLTNQVARLARIRWYDLDADRTYSLSDRVELIFTEPMSNATITLQNLVMSRYTNANDFAILASYTSNVAGVWGIGAGGPVATNSVLWSNDTHFVITLGTLPGITIGDTNGLAVGPDMSNLVSKVGQRDLTYPPVRLPKYPVGQDSDGDGMPDDWEEYYGLDPMSAEGDDGGYGDPDKDGLINLYEYQASLKYDPVFVNLLSPIAFDSDGDGLGDYDSRFADCESPYGIAYDDGDDMPDLWEADYPGMLSRFAYDSHLDSDGDGWNNYAEYMFEGTTTDTNGATLIVRGTDPTVGASYPTPKIRGVIKYEGIAAGTHHIVGYQTNLMDGLVMATGTVTNDGNVVRFEISGFPYNRDVYLFAWKGGAAFATNNPHGLATYQPIKMTWSGVDGVEVGISDRVATDRPFYPSFSWTVPGGATRTYVRIIRTYPGSVNRLIMTKWINAPRNHFQEADYALSTMVYGDHTWGLPPASYTWSAAVSDTAAAFASGGFTVTAGGMSTPTLIYPTGAAVVQETEVEARWSLANPASKITMQVTLPSGAVQTFTFKEPWRSALKEYRYKFPFLFGQGVYTNGTYKWRLQASNGETSGAWSSEGTFLVNIVPPAAGGSPSLSGEVRYYGMTATNLIVEAYATAGFSGQPIAQFKAASLNGITNAFEVLGLHHKVYYLRAFLDVNNNGAHDAWEPHGAARDRAYGGDRFEYWTEYRIGAFDLTQVQTLNNAVIVIRDRDTDSDNMPDAWEMRHFGNLGKTGAADSDGDGLTDSAEFACGTKPGVADTDGDGVKDGAEFLMGTSPFATDSDGDGFQDAIEIALGSDPNVFGSVPAGPALVIVNIAGVNHITWNVVANPISLNTLYSLRMSVNAAPFANVAPPVTYLHNGDSAGPVSVQHTPPVGIVIYDVTVQVVP